MLFESFFFRWTLTVPDEVEIDKAHEEIVAVWWCCKCSKGPHPPGFTQCVDCPHTWCWHCITARRTTSVPSESTPRLHVEGEDSGGEWKKDH